LWDYDEFGLNRRRESSINDIPISESERRIFGTRPESDHGKDVIPLR
jgi:nuclear transport factor 2 (NTF2) superfamily protein